jgi:transposase
VRFRSVWQRVLGLVHTVVEGVDVDAKEHAVVISVRPTARARQRCGRCGRRSPWYDRGEGRRRWRSLDLGITKAYLEADAPRVECRRHGPTVAAVPWARHRAGHTRAFDDTVAWLAVACSKSAVKDLMRVAWASVGAIIERVSADIEATVDRLEGLRRIGIDEISHKRGHKYLTVVVDHDTRRLVWAGPGRSDAALEAFFDLLGPTRAALVTHVSADAAPWIARVVEKHCPRAVRCADPFHIVAWATEALDEVRRAAWNQARGGRPQAQASRDRQARPRKGHELKGVRWALWKNPQDLTARQRHQLEWIAGNHPSIWRAYRLKEGLRYVFAVKGEEGKEALGRWLSWAARSRLAPFVELAKKIRKHRPEIEASLEHGLSQGLTESINAKIRLLIRVAYGFQGPEPLIALALLSLGGQRPMLPGRRRPTEE